MKTLDVVACLVFVVGGLNGCDFGFGFGFGFGGIAFHSRESRFEEFDLGRRGAVVPRSHSREETFEHFILGGPGEILPESTAARPTREEVQEGRGQPDSMREGKEGSIIWRYRGRWKWTGLVPIFNIALPLPLMVPTGSDYVDIYFRDEIAVEAVRSFGVYSAAWIGRPSSDLINRWDEQQQNRIDGFHRRSDSARSSGPTGGSRSFSPRTSQRRGGRPAVPPPAAG